VGKNRRAALFTLIFRHCQEVEMSEEPVLGRQAQKTKIAREKIIGAAISLIRNGGFAAASSSKIAQQAGFTWGAAQHHFGSKEEILDAVLDLSHAEFTKLMDDKRLRLGSKTERVTLFIDLMWQHYQSDVYLAALEILLAARGVQDGVESIGTERQSRGHVKTLREIFNDSKLTDKQLLEALEFVHCFLTGLTIESVFETKTASAKQFLSRIKTMFEVMLNGK
jgi:AcrR family transcriptional regulator